MPSQLSNWMNTKHKVGKGAMTDDAVMQQIYLIRGREVIIDSDLSALYGYETKRMNEQVKRNQERFPASFMFQLTPEEVESLRLQCVTTNLLTRTRTTYFFPKVKMSRALISWIAFSGVIKPEFFSPNPKNCNR